MLLFLLKVYFVFLIEITKIIKGRNPNGSEVFSTNPDIKIPVPISSRQTPPKLHDKISMSMGGTMLPIPPTMHSINSFGFNIFLGMYKSIAVKSPANAPSESPAAGL